MLVQDANTEQELGPAILGLLGDEQERDRMSAAMAAMGVQNAAEAIASEVVRLARA